MGESMEVKLIVVGGKSAGQKVPVAGPKFFVGRAEDCHLRPSSDLVSRHHAVILVEEGFVAVRDFGSKNGTFVNGEQVRTERELKNGDRLKIGPLEFEVELAVDVGGKKKPKIHSIQEAAARTVQSADDGEPDISDWLDEDEATATTPQADTRTMQNTQALTGDTSILGEDSPPEEAKEEPKKPRRLPPKPAAEDTQSAADEMLRKLFSKRR